MDLQARLDFHHEKGEWQFPNQQTYLRPWRLYRSAEAGRLTCQPGELQAGEKTELTLTFTAAVDYPAGARLRLFTPGFNPYNFLYPQPFEGRATVTVIGPDGSLDPVVSDTFNRRAVIQALPSGLSAGQSLVFTIGAGQTFDTSEIARPIPFYIELLDDEPGDPPPGRLIDFVEIPVQPLELAGVQLLMDPILRPGESADVKLFAHDRYLNYADENVELIFQPADGATTPESADLVIGDRGRRTLGRAISTAESGVVRITAEYGGGKLARSAPSKVVSADEETMTVAFGDLHCHDFLSPGSVSPMDYYANAQNIGLHFLALPVQSHGKNLDARKWAIAMAVAEDIYRPGEFVTIPAFEWQHYAFGHKNVYYLHADQPYLCPYDKRYDTVSKLYDALSGSDAIVLPHHPGYALDCHVPGTDWSVVDDRFEPVAEIVSCHGISECPDSERPLNKPGEGTWMQSAWSAGLHVGVIGGSDSHSGMPVNSPREPRPYLGGMACLWVRERTRRGIFEALQARRTYATTGARILLDVRMGDHRMGETAPAGTLRNLGIEAHGTAAIERIEIMRNNEVLETIEPACESVELEFTDENPPTGEGEDWYYLRLRQSDGEMAWSSPIWVKRT